MSADLILVEPLNQDVLLWLGKADSNNLLVSATSYSPYEYVYLAFNIMNQGDTEAASSYWKVEVDGTQISPLNVEGEWNCGILYPGIGTSLNGVCLGMFEEIGEHTLTFTLDPANQIAEGEDGEANNVYTTTFTVQSGQADLAFRGFFEYVDSYANPPEVLYSSELPILLDKSSETWEDVEIEATGEYTYNAIGTFTTDENVFVSFTMHNQGNDDITNSFNWTITVDGKQKYSSAINLDGTFMPPNSFISEHHIDLGRFASGEHTMVISVDKAGTVLESDEDNNEISLTFTVEAGANEYVPPTYLLSTNWKQTGVDNGVDYPYNKYTPHNKNKENEYDEGYLTGCVPLANGQILYYWAQQGYNVSLEVYDTDYFVCQEHDVKGDYTKSITVTGENLYQYCTISLAELNDILSDITYDEPNPNRDTDADICGLTLAGMLIGTNVVAHCEYDKTNDKNQYVYDVTSANLDTSILSRAHFNATKVSEFTDETWLTIKDNVLDGKPAIVSSARLEHALIVDGYDKSTGEYHLNFGWGNITKQYGEKECYEGDGWYSAEELEALEMNSAIVDISPNYGKSPDLVLVEPLNKDVLLWLSKTSSEGLVSAAYYTPNENVFLSFNIKNQGNALAASSYWKIEVDGELINPSNMVGEHNGGNLYPGTGNSFNGVNLGQFELGKHTLTFTLDPNNQVAEGEKGEANNVYTTEFYVINDESTSGEVVDGSALKEYLEAEDKKIGSVILSTGDKDIHIPISLSSDNVKVSILGSTFDEPKVIFADEEGNHLDQGNGTLKEKLLSEKPMKLVANEDGIADVFLARTSGELWTDEYVAVNKGYVYIENEEIKKEGGHGEMQGIASRNKIFDVFAGSEDANVLLLTDDKWPEPPDNLEELSDVEEPSGPRGDALFLDDIYSATGHDTKAKARISQINEIYAGAGDDVIDMSSSRFEYQGSGMIIHGGDGDDVIWANKGSNVLFGDAGDDWLIGSRYYDEIFVGGTGDDQLYGLSGNNVFCFGANWGNDYVQVMAEGSATLVFVDGLTDYSWNADNMQFTCGANSVRVDGMTENLSIYVGDELVYNKTNDAVIVSKNEAIGAFDYDDYRPYCEKQDSSATIAHA